MDRAEKQGLVSTLNKTFSEAELVVVTHYHGLTAAEAGDLRRRMKEAGVKFRVTKNRLTRRALVGTPYEPLSDLFTGPTAIAYSHDPLAAAKAAVEYAKGSDKLVVIGGAMGEQRFDEGGIKALAALPSLDELRSMLVGMLATPATRIATVMQAPAVQLARVLSAYGSKGEEV